MSEQPLTAPAPTLDGLLRRLLREVVRDVVREELAARAEHATMAVAATSLPELQLLTAREAAAVARVSEKTLRDWVRSGRLPARYAGRQLRIDRADLGRFLAAGGGGERVDVDALADDLLRRRRRGG